MLTPTRKNPALTPCSGGQGRVGRGHCRGQHAPAPQDGEGAGLGVAADEVDHDVDLLGHVLEPLGPVVDHHVGPKVTDVRDVGCAGSGDHTCPGLIGELHRVRAHIARRTVDQNRLARP